MMVVTFHLVLMMLHLMMLHDGLVMPHFSLMMRHFSLMMRDYIFMMRDHGLMVFFGMNGSPVGVMLRYPGTVVCRPPSTIMPHVMFVPVALATPCGIVVGPFRMVFV